VCGCGRNDGTTRGACDWRCFCGRPRRSSGKTANLVSCSVCHARTSHISLALGLLATCNLRLPRELLVCLACPRTSHISVALGLLATRIQLVLLSVPCSRTKSIVHHTFCCLACTLHMLPRDRLACAHRVSRVARWPMQLGQRALLSQPALSRCVAMRHCEWQQSPWPPECLFVNVHTSES
jgi:hypothetical protein